MISPVSYLKGISIRIFRKYPNTQSLSLSLYMASNLLHFRPAVIGACAQRADQDRRKNPSSSNQWIPLFGWSSEPDYIDSTSKTHCQEKTLGVSESGSNPKALSTRYAPGCFTEEKAKQLRMMTMETEAFHDAMYHSTIASRLASDFRNRYNW